MPELPHVEGFRRQLADEICRRARIRPTVALSELGDDDVKALHHAMTRVLRTAVRPGRVPGPPRWLTGVRSTPTRAARAVARGSNAPGWAAGRR